MKLPFTFPDRAAIRPLAVLLTFSGMTVAGYRVFAAETESARSGNSLASGVPAWSDPGYFGPPGGDAEGYPSRDPSLDALPGFQNPPPGYGEVPFWWWTGDPLDEERLLWQVEELHKKGIAGMQVNYAHEDTPGWPTYRAEPEIFSPKWWEIWSRVAERCGKYKMGIGVSGYTIDWPNGRSLISHLIYGEREIQGRELVVANKVRVASGGSVDSAVPADTAAVRAYPAGGIDFGPESIDLTGSIQNGHLTWTPPKNAQGKTDWEVWIFTAARKPGTLNPIHPLAGSRVIEKFFQQFQDHAPDRSAAGLNYFFHDELQFGVGDRIWADDLAEEFKKRKGYDLFEALPAMFSEVGPKTVKYRLDYMDVKMQLAQERYFIPIFRWHWSRGKIYGCDQASRGRNPSEFGDYFSSVRWYTAPGHDTPGGRADLIKGKVSSSIAQLYKRPRVWLEGYHSLGWGATPERLMFATRENYLYGCTLLNLHGLYYTTHGSFWEWAPPCYHFRMPYWDHMGTFLKYFERLSYLMSQGSHRCDVAVMYPVASCQAGSAGGAATKTAFEAGSTLLSSGYDFLFMDFESAARAEIRDGRLHVSDASYRVLVLPSMRVARWSTLEKAREFFRAGGIVVAVDALPEASDRAGSDDPVLDALVKELFGVTAKEIEGGAQPAEQTSANGGRGIALLAGRDLPARTYDGGFVGRWAWSKEPRQKVYFKAVYRTNEKTPQDCRIRFFCDNEGTLYVNGSKLCSGADYSSGWLGNVKLKDGDVITVDGKDHDAPGSRHTAGMFLAVAVDGKTVLSTEDFRYTLAQPKSDTWRTDPALAGLSAVDPTNVHELHRRGSSAKLGSRLVAAIEKQVLREVQSAEPIKATHRQVGPRDVYLVMGATKGSQCTFRATGRAELWDPWTGNTRPVRMISRDEACTTVQMPLESYEAQLIVFTPEENGISVPATTLAEITDVRTVGGKVEVRGYADGPGKETATVEFGGRTLTLHGEAPASLPPMVVDGEWESELKPTMDNRWGDFRLPVTQDTIGAEARIFRYALETTPKSGLEAKDFDDSHWPRVTTGFGLKFWKLGPLPKDTDVAAVEAKLAALKAVDPTRPIEIAGKSYFWTPYAFSWRNGKEGDPGHQGYHGLKENVSDDFIRLGKPRDGLNETLYGEEETGTRYYLWTSAFSPQSTEAKIIAGGELKPAAVYLNGTAVENLDGDLALKAGSNPLLIRYDTPGRGHFVLEDVSGSSKKHSKQDARTPLSMRWYDHPGLLPLDAMPQVTHPACWYRFVAPPGLKGMTLTAHGKVEAWADGRPMRVVAVETAAHGAVRYQVTPAEPVRGNAVVAFRIEPVKGYLGGSAVPEPVRLDCGNGTIALGDWSKGSALECYSGGIWYRKTITLTPAQAGGRVILDLGRVVATVEVRINGESAGIRVAPPWRLDITDLVKPGENRIEILVYNTLANHYRTVPTRYRGNPESGLMGPVRLEFPCEVRLSE